MRRNPRPYKSSVDRRKLLLDNMEREARATAMASRGAMEGALDRELLPRDLPRLTLPKR